MKKLIKAIEKMKPFFDAVARNVYLKSIKDGFISCMPIVIFSSIFLLVAMYKYFDSIGQQISKQSL